MPDLKQFIDTIDSYLGGSVWFPFLLIGTGLFFTIYLKFPQFRFFRHALRVVTGKYEKDSFQGDTTHFQSLATALSGTVGTGNIGGVGLALYIGGPAALFWMWVTAFLGMTTKFVECTLSHKYRSVDEFGQISGGPMYFMEKKLKMKWLAVIFAIATVICAFGTGNMPQINNITTSIQATFGIAPWLTAGILSIILGLIILGGIKRIAKVTEKIVPFMAFVYITGAIIVIFSNYQQIVPSFFSIFSNVFTGSSAAGGFLGASFAFAFNRGVNRGIYSNEAGQGSAAIAHSAAKADEPVSEGMVSILEPFIDTLIICTITGLTVLASGVWTEKFANTFQQSDMMVLSQKYHEQNQDHVRQLHNFLLNQEDHQVELWTGTLPIKNGIISVQHPITIIHARSIAEDIVCYKNKQLFSGDCPISNGKIMDSSLEFRGKSLVHSAVLTTKAFQRSIIGKNGEYIVSIGLLLFAFSTVISWSYYGDRAVTYLLGNRFVMPYRFFYIIAFFSAALMDTSIVWSVAAVAIVLMAVPNLFGILMLHKDMKQSIVEYWQKFKQEYPTESEKYRLPND